MATLPPTSQQPADRPISFLLDDNVSGIGPAAAVTLRVRPQDLSRTDPSRLNVTQTLGGAWADSFGPGVAMINISGNTGWRATEGSGEDGEARFQSLRDQVWTQWHLRRQEAINAGKDPSGVQLIYSDSLDNIVAVVAPMSFNLRRHVRNPLLLMYQIQMLVLSDSPGALVGPPELGPPSGNALSSLGLDSLSASLDSIKSFADRTRANIDSALLAPVNSFLGTTQAIYSKVRDTWQSVAGVSDSLVSVANSSAAAGATLFRTLALVVNTPELVKMELLRVAGAYTNIYCVLRNALGFPDEFVQYSGLYGSSNCSSTSGGQPLSQFRTSNTMEALVPAPVTPLVTVTTAAQSSLVALSANDIVLAPMTAQVAAQHAGNIGSGIVLS